MYSIEMLELSDSHFAGEPIRIKARLFKDTTIITDPSIRVKARITDYPSKSEKRQDAKTIKRRGMYIWDYDQPMGDKFNIQMVAFWEEEENVLTEFRKMILVKESPSVDSVDSAISYNKFYIAIFLLLIIIVIFFYFSKKLFDSYGEMKTQRELKKLERKASAGLEEAGKHIDNNQIGEGKKALKEVFQKLKGISKVRQEQQDRIFSNTSEFAYEKYEKSIERNLNRYKYLTKREFNDKKFELRKEYLVSIFKEDPELLSLTATQHGIANMILHSIKQEKKYESNFFEDIAIIMDIFEKNKQGLINTFSRIEYGLNTLENKVEHTEIKHNVYKSYIELLRVKDENVDTVLKNTVKSIKDVPSYIPMYKELLDLYSKVYNSFKVAFRSHDRMFLTKIREFVEQCPNRDRENRNYRIYRNVLKAIEDRIQKNTTVKSREADIGIMLLDEKEVFYSEKNGHGKSGHITLPIRLVNKGASPAWNIAIWIELDKDSHFAPSAYHNILSIYPTPEILPDAQEDEFGNIEIKRPGIGLIPIKLYARHGKINNKNRYIKIKLIKFFIDFIDYSIDKNQGEPRESKQEFEDIVVKFLPIDEIHNPYGDNFCLKLLPKVFCDRKNFVDFVKEKMKSKSNNVLNLYGLPGTGKTSFMFNFQQKEKENYMIIILTRTERLDTIENYSKKVKSDNYMLFFSDSSKTETLDNHNFLAIFNRELDRKIKMNKPVVLFVDDVDDLIKDISDWGGKWLENFLKSLHNLLKRKENVNIVVCGRKSLKEIQIEDDDNWKNLISMSGSSDSKEFTPLDKDEAQAFFNIKSKVNGESVYTEHAIKSILRKTGGNPRLLQATCYNLMESKKDWKYDRPLDFWDVDEISNIIIQKERAWYLYEIWNGFDEAEQAVLKILANRLKTDDKSVRLIERPSYLSIREELLKTGSLNKNEYPTDVIKRLISKGIIMNLRSLLDFRIGLLRKWINVNISRSKTSDSSKKVRSSAFRR
ncbi:ATP-binding protein [Desulfonema magnum]|uniref:ATP-binding protein n=1 Tax=Desulfonema magnum TaxID=45655 RepID=UPI001A9A850D|nr:ATP-binding protein [Desulfonema magnum]